MSWASATTSAAPVQLRPALLARVPLANVDLTKVVTIDFETYFDADYTLKKQSTSEYIRDPRFLVHMAGVKIGNNPVKVYSREELPKALSAIDWATHSLLCHNAAFDGFILAHHYGVVPARYLDTLCMARGLHSNDVRANLDSVAQFYGVGNKVPDILNGTKGLRTFTAEQYKGVADYCAEDARLTYEIFKQMLVNYPASELDLVHLTIRMFCQPALKVDIKRVEQELAREIKEKEQKLLNVIGDKVDQAALILMKGRIGALEYAKKLVSGTTTFVELLTDLGVKPPMKKSPTTGKDTYAFATTDADFVELSMHHDERVRNLVDCRMSVKSTTNETRAGRFLEAGKNGASLPVLLLYYGAHTGRLSGGNKMNMQNLKRGGELRKSILAPEGHNVLVADSGQIEARICAWISEQEDLLEDFRQYDLGLDRDAYCKFADLVYPGPITKANETERFVGKVCVLGLGYSMGAPKLQSTLAMGIMGPPVFLELGLCQKLVSTYRQKNYKIPKFWKLCNKIIEDMHSGATGQYKCISWERGAVNLPNGMQLKYPGLKKTQRIDGNNEWSYLRKNEPVKIYGGLLCENIVQALARIVVCDQMLEADKHMQVVTMTHDEIVAIAPKKTSAKQHKKLLQIMSVPPAWCPDLPLAAEGGYAVNYSK